MIKLNVRWGTKKFEVNANTGDEPLVFKMQLFALTGVEPDRQKVLIKGKQLKDDTWEGITIQNGTTIMLMGSTAEINTSILENELTTAIDTNKAQFNEKENQIILPVGLKNLGNTCYMNACLQVFKAIPELSKALENYNETENNANNRFFDLIVILKKLYDSLERLEKINYYGTEDGCKKIIPIFFLNMLENTFPQFATRDSHGKRQQQDANECFSELLQALTSETNIPLYKSEELKNKLIKTSRIFQIEFEVTLKCLESDGELFEKTQESQLQLSCYLKQDVKYIQSGIRNRLTEEIEKFSNILQRNVKYEKKTQISRLPQYLCIQMVRFFYKKKDQINAKILKDVKFPINLDVYEECTPELKQQLQLMRDRYKIYDDKKVEKMRRLNLNQFSNKEYSESQTLNQNFWPNSFLNDPGSNNSGFYELKAVITHKGRSSNSGHYVAWVRTSNNNWAMCDDDEVHPVTEEEILKLSGGGDWHCAYVLIYGPRLLPKDDDELSQTSLENDKEKKSTKVN